MRAALVWATLTLAGCNQILGIGDFSTGEGAIDAMADAPPDRVTATAMMTHVLDGSVVMRPRDMSRLDIQVYVVDPDEPSGFTIIDVEGDDTGTLSIDGIPPGATYYLKLRDPDDPSSTTQPFFFVTDQRVLDLGYETLGDVGTPTTIPTPITLDASGLTPWITGDTLYVTAYGRGIDGIVFEGIADNSTTASVTIDWNAILLEQAFSGFRGPPARPAPLLGPDDELVIAHVGVQTPQTTDTEGYPVHATTIVDVATVSTTMTDGSPLTVPVAFSPAAKEQPGQHVLAFTAQLRNALRDGGNYTFEFGNCSRYATPGASFGLVSGPPILTINFPTEMAIRGSVDHTTGPYANPFPPSYPEAITCTFFHQRRWKVPSGSSVSSISLVQAWEAATDDFQFFPEITSPTNVRVAGVDVSNGGTAPFDGVAPVTVTWDAVFFADRYQVMVLDMTNGFSLTATITTVDTSVLVPADLLVQGHMYIFRIVVIQSDSDYQDGHLLRVSLPAAQIRHPTGLFRLSDQCGDGEMDPGEACDTGGDSVNCDADCTAAECGDGYANAAANETCDTIGDTWLCDEEDCTARACNDGSQNLFEQCEDDDTVSGDGCSADCLSNETCGNLIIDFAANEQCEPPGTPTCDSACQAI